MNTRRIISIVLLLLISQFIFAQVAINTDGSNADASALLDVKSTTKGFLPPRMTASQRDAIVNPVEGLVLYCIDCKQLQVHDGTVWRNMMGGTVPSTLPTQTVDVTNTTTGDTWMDRNLGAAQAATSYDDYLAYGSMFQWGRLADGHEQISYSSSISGTAVTGTTTTLSSTDVPGHSLFIASAALPYDWRSPQNSNLWQGVNGINNPCPAGYRLPTDVEWNNERLSWASNNTAGAYGSVLKITAPGLRYFSDGVVQQVGNFGYYWTSTISASSDLSRHLFISSSAGFSEGRRANGYSVRCIKD